MNHTAHTQQGTLREVLLWYRATRGGIVGAASSSSGSGGGMGLPECLALHFTRESPVLPSRFAQSTITMRPDIDHAFSLSLSTYHKPQARCCPACGGCWRWACCTPTSDPTTSSSGAHTDIHMTLQPTTTNPTTQPNIPHVHTRGPPGEGRLVAIDLGLAIDLWAHPLGTRFTGGYVRDATQRNALRPWMIGRSDTKQTLMQ